MKRLAVFVLFATLAGCGGAGGSTVLPQSARTQPDWSAGTWSATFRYQPVALSLSLHSASMQFLYIDDAPVNGVVPQTQELLNDFSQANPNVTNGACSANAVLSVAPIAPSSVSGQQTPTIVISAYPSKVGTCTQTVQLGLAGTQQFTLTVTP